MTRAIPFLKSVSVGLGLAMISLGVTGCAGNEERETPYVERPVGELYTVAARKLDAGAYIPAALLFEEVERQHPYSQWARRAMLMSAFAYYQGNEYEDALSSLDRYIALHPGGAGAPYAHYLKALCWYERIHDVGRDQGATKQAVAALTEVVRRFPETDYARDAQYKLDMTQDHLAGKEMEVGRWYLRNGNLLAAINRFKTVVDDYETTAHTAEALYRLTEAYLLMGVTDEAFRNAAVLGHNYPGSEWYKKAYETMSKKEGVPMQLPPRAKLERGDTPQRG